MHHDLQRCANPTDVANDAAAYVARSARRAIEERGRFTLAVSGGRTPGAMFAALATYDLRWRSITLFQVDERVAPSGDEARNLTALTRVLGPLGMTIHPMAVDYADLDQAAREYEELLPHHFDLVHLGLGADGHTASLVSNDPVVVEEKRLVAVTGPYQGHRRMTLTYPALARASQLLWLVTGSDKRSPLAALLEGDRSIPAGRVSAAASLVMADAEALIPNDGAALRQRSRPTRRSQPVEREPELSEEAIDER